MRVWELWGNSVWTQRENLQLKLKKFKTEKKSDYLLAERDFVMKRIIDCFSPWNVLIMIILKIIMKINTKSSAGASGVISWVTRLSDPRWTFWSNWASDSSRCVQTSLFPRPAQKSGFVSLRRCLRWSFRGIWLDCKQQWFPALQVWMKQSSQEKVCQPDFIQTNLTFRKACSRAGEPAEARQLLVLQEAKSLRSFNCFYMLYAPIKHKNKEVFPC